MSQPSLPAVKVNSAYALIVGISQYRDQRIPNLNFTHADARAFYNLLLDPQHAGFAKENVRLLLDEEATLFNFKNAISGWLFQHVVPDSTVMVFYAGHGGVESDKTATEADGISKYLLPWDADSDNLFASALSNSEFNRLLSTIRAKRLVILMDACYAGGVAQRGARDVGIMDDPSRRLAEGEGRMVISAAKPNQRSWEDASLGHGIFTHHLIEALKGKADADNDGYVSIMELYKYLESHVPKSVMALAKSVQEPLLCGDLSKDIYLTVNSGRIAEKQAQIEKDRTRIIETLRAKRRKLFDLHDNGFFTAEVYQEALSLIEKPVSELTATQKKLSKNLEAMLREGINYEEYLENRESICREPAAPTPPIPTKPEVGFCIGCGKKLIAQNLFCVGCGRRI